MPFSQERLRGSRTWSRNVVHWAKVRNYVAQPSHFTNQKLQDVWLAED